MTIVGMVGGLGPESTIDYYRRTLAAWHEVDPSSAPSIVIDSLDAQRALRLAGGDRAAFTEYLLESLRRLAGAGADFAVLTANTAHLVFDDLAARSTVPLQFTSLIGRLRDDAGVDAVILDGTELPLLLSDPVIAGVPLLDTTALHVAAIVRRLRQNP